MNVLMEGMSAMGCIVIMLFFLRFWKRTDDRFFLIFAVAFSLMCVTRFVATALGPEHSHQRAAYVVRLLAYLLILLAIADKNRPAATPTS